MAKAVTFTTPAGRVRTATQSRYVLIGAYPQTAQPGAYYPPLVLKRSSKLATLEGYARRLRAQGSRAQLHLGDTTTGELLTGVQL